MNTYGCEHTPGEYCQYCRYLYLNPAPDPAVTIKPHPPFFPDVPFEHQPLSQMIQPAISYPPSYYPPPGYPPPDYPSDYPPPGHSPVIQPSSTRYAQRNPMDILDECYPEDSEESNRLRALLATCLKSPWYTHGQLEPQGALDQFIYEHSSNNFICSVHQCQAFRDRLEKMRDHVRVHIDHRPYPCPGCHKPNCTARFCTKEARNAHEEIDRKKTTCSICGQVTAKKNFRRHLDSRRCQRCRGDSGPGSHSQAGTHGSRQGGPGI